VQSPPSIAPFCAVRVRVYRSYHGERAPVIEIYRRDSQHGIAKRTQMKIPFTKAHGPGTIS